MAEYIPEWKLERYLLGELEKEEMSLIDGLRTEDPELEKRIALLEESNREILETYTSEKMAAEITHRAELSGTVKRAPVRPARKWYRMVLYPAGVLMTALFVFLFVQPLIITDAPVEGPETIRLKGMKPGLYVFRNTGDGPELLRNGDTAYAGDLVQLGYMVKDAAYGVIFSIDGRGVVTLHFPSNKKSSTKLTTGEKVLLETAYRLDDAPLFERFFMLTSENNIEVQEIIEAAKELAEKGEDAADSTLTVNKSFSRYSILIRKGKRQ